MTELAKKQYETIIAYPSYFDLHNTKDIYNYNYSICGILGGKGEDDCGDCIFNIKENDCATSYSSNSELPEILNLLQQTHPELFI